MDAGGAGWPAGAGPAADWTGWCVPPGASSGGRKLRSPLGSLAGRDSDLVGHGGHGEPSDSVGRQVATRDDDQVTDRLVVSDQIDGYPLEGQDHGAVQDTVVP